MPKSKDEIIANLQAQLIESQRIRAMKQRKICGLKNSLIDARGENANKKKYVLVDGSLEMPHEEIGDA